MSQILIALALLCQFENAPQYTLESEIGASVKEFKLKNKNLNKKECPRVLLNCLKRKIPGLLTSHVEMSKDHASKMVTRCYLDSKFGIAPELIK